MPARYTADPQRVIQRRKSGGDMRYAAIRFVQSAENIGSPALLNACDDVVQTLLMTVSQWPVLSRIKGSRGGL